MKKWIRSAAVSAALVTGFSGLAFIGGDQALAQGAKTPATKAAAPTAKAPEVKAEGKVVYSKDKQGKYRFKVLNAEGKTLAMSTVGYEKLEDALKVIDEVKALINSKKPEEEK